MNLVYRSAKGAPLTAGEIDTNFRNLAEGLAGIQAGTGATIVDIVVSDGAMSILMSDGQDFGPFPLESGDGGTVGISHADSNNQLYGSRNGGWTPFNPGIGDAPADGRPYARRDEDWILIPDSAGTGTGIAEAPNDGQLYARNGQTEAWSAIASTGSASAATRLDGSAWSASKTYAKGELVEHINGNLWRATSASTGQAPTIGSSYWQPLSLGGRELTLAISQLLYHDGTGGFRTIKAVLDDILTRMSTAKI